MKQQRVLIAVVIIISAILAFIFREMINDVLLAPIGQAFLLIQIYMESVPQFFIWLILLVVLLVLILKSFLGIRNIFQDRSRELMRRKMGPIESWQDWIMRATTGRYFEGKLTARVADLAVNVLAFRHELSEQEVIKKLEQGELELDPEVLSYVQSGIGRDVYDSYRYHILGGLTLVKSREQIRKLNNNITAVIDDLNGKLRG